MPSARRLLATAGSLRLALPGLVGLALLAVLAPSGWAIGPGLALLALNLAAAWWRHPLLRRSLPLAVAHAAVLALLGLVGWGRLSALDGRFELAEGVPFDGHLIDQRSGALYRPVLGRLGFAQQGFEIDYAAGRRRGATRNRVVWRDDTGRWQRAEIGDHRPLVLDGHRITTTPNKGFAPVLRWQPDAAVAEGTVGVVHLPSFPAQELNQAREWALPDGRRLWVMLQVDEPLLDPDRAGRWTVPRAHRLVLRDGERRAELRPGDRVPLAGGTLAYERLSTWMGYRITHDPSLPWLLADGLLLAAAMAAHLVQAWRRQPLPADVPGEAPAAIWQPRSPAGRCRHPAAADHAPRGVQA